MKKFLQNSSSATTQIKEGNSAAEKLNQPAENIVEGLKASDNAFKEFICPICLKLIQKCVTTLCGHSYCESCLEDYLLFKEVSRKLNFFLQFNNILLPLLLYRLASYVIFTEWKAS